MTQIKKLVPATFKKRHNRFVSSVELNGREIRVYVPNTGRLSEMAIPGRKVLLVPSNGKYKYKMLYIFYKGRPIMIDSSYSNSLFFKLLEDNIVPHLKGYTIIKREPSYKNHRFDFLVKDKSGVEYFIELKSCTLAWNNTASFPDAISTRASAHGKILGLCFKRKV